MTVDLTGPCTLCDPPDHNCEDHPECVECGGTFEPLDAEGVCGTCRVEDALSEVTDVQTINMTPTDEGYANIAMTMLDSVLRDVKASRRGDSRVLLDSVVALVAYLAVKDPEQVKRIREYIDEEARL